MTSPTNGLPLETAMPEADIVRTDPRRAKEPRPRSRLPSTDYPESDGEPMAETPIHWHATVDLAHAMHVWHQDRADAYVGSDMMMYYERDNPRRYLAPDVFVVRGVPKLPERRVWLIWDEGGRAPDFVMEVTSRSTRLKDEHQQAAIYAELGVYEYWQFDPTRDYLDPALKFPRLGADGRYRTLPLQVHGRVLRQRSELGLELHLLDGERLRCFDPAQGVYRPTRAGSEQGRREAEAARDEAEADLLRANARVAELERRLRDLERQ